MRSRQSLLCILAAVVVVITASGSNAIELVGRATMVQADSIPMGLPGDTVWDFSGVRPLPGSKTWVASNPISNVDPTGNFLLENMDIENYNYPLVAVFFSNRDKVLEDDYMAAKNANVPIMVVDNMGGDFTNAMSCFTNMLGCSTDIYTINSHGSPGALSVPNEDNSDFVNMDFTSDFTALKDGLSDKIVFIGACNVGEGFTGSTFTQLMPLQTNSTVITSEQPIKAGYKYDGGPDLVPSSFQFYNHYKMSEKGLLPSEITDVKMDKNRGITWRENYFWSKPYNSDNKVSTLWFQQ